jgi:hypothetical protein
LHVSVLFFSVKQLRSDFQKIRGLPFGKETRSEMWSPLTQLVECMTVNHNVRSSILLGRGFCY